MPRIFSWLMSCAILVLLTSCSDFDKEFTVRSAKSTIDVSLDGTALVSESFDISVNKMENYGGFYVDIPQRFTDASGGVHWRDFALVAARRDGSDEYYFKENNVPGYSIYIGKEHCKRCPADLFMGVTKIQIAYRLGRLVRQEGDRQVLFLPAYMGRVHDQGAKKTLTLGVPPGGALRPSRDDPAAYEIIQKAPDEFVVSIAAGKRDRVLQDIEIEYPGGTFLGGTSDWRMRWWFSDHFLPFLSILGPLIVGLVVILKFRPSWLLPAPLIVVDVKMTESISPALAAYLFQNWKADAAKAAFMASVCHLAVKRTLRISSLDENADASDLLSKHERRRGKAGRGKWYGLPAATRLVFGRIGKERSVGDRRRVKNARPDVRDQLHRTVTEEYQKVRGIDRWSLAAVVSILALGIAVACFSGLLIFSAAICGILLILFLVLMMVRHPEQFPVPTDGFERFKRAVSLFVGFPVMVIFAISYIGTTEVISEQRPYLVAILLNIVGMVIVLAMLRMPTPKQRRIHTNILILNRYLRGEIDGPAMSIECYEHYLPFAVALDVQHYWTERFNFWRESEKMDAYAPDWLIGSQTDGIIKVSSKSAEE
ncbi:DUF2207 domain-containing protein [Rhizobium ruizarguesonis]|uniref:DUF2207 family protein n=1 Tax=Rhizobium ruizarguesonis TaxID=2081791 RepID=UPI0013B76BD8|nr:DUF2207 domain-containing protein [Rhizobium ruizarguesonis]NEH30827.1 DUF2207 domain-containing protein [Rhizobium ruizarguesonis]NEJ10549.1 DUF2207 domain-containing protein [Rhizobium ruizarguesonis]NEK13124.1 DUF2207 domain-containing protein [Rhizobium ruizarguesonis]QIJ43219.1 DUF2207 domain-containing protein [Rhizobium leguminosarum]